MSNRIYLFMAQVFEIIILITINIQAQKVPAEYDVALFIYDNVEILDFAGPSEVFEAAGCNVYTVGITTEPIISQGFIKIVPEYTIGNCPKPDIIVLPGGDVQMIEENLVVQNWINACANYSEIILSVCNGAMLLAKAGILDGKEATSHYGSIPRLRETATKTLVHDDVRFVDNGQVITTAGVSAGIDGSLHIIRKLFNEELAVDVAKYMMYDKWDPDAGLVVDK